MTISIVDYGMGNIASIARKFECSGSKVTIANSPKAITNAEKLILPGVGHFGKAMNNLQELGLIEALNQAVLTEKKPILGICLGVQLMLENSEEGHVDGLGWVSGKVVRFNVKDALQFKVPHMGWNQLNAVKNSVLMNGIDTNEEFYFVHGYHMIDVERSSVLSTTDYSYPFVSSIARDNIFGVQFHPEKSHDSGELLLKNFACL